MGKTDLLRIKSVQGSSIVEVVTAMLIISLSMAATGILFAQVFGSSRRFVRHEAWFAANLWVEECRLMRDVKPESLELPHFTLVKTSDQMDADKNLWLVTIEATTPGGALLVQRRFLLEVASDLLVDDLEKERR